MWIFGCSDLSFGALYDDHYGLVIDSVIDLVIHAYFFDFLWTKGGHHNWHYSNFSLNGTRECLDIKGHQWDIAYYQLLITRRTWYVFGQHQGRRPWPGTPWRCL